VKLYLFRHGQTDWNKAHRFQGHIDIPLNEYGRELARITARNWPIVPYDRVYCSPLIRAVETAQIILDGRPEKEMIKTDQRIIEFGFGPCEGHNIDEAAGDPQNPMYNLLHHPEKYNPTNGAESFYDLVDRAGAFLRDEILPLEQQGIENVLVVAHGALIRGVVCAAGKKEIRDFWQCPYYNCSLTTLDITHGEITLEREAEVFYDASGSFGGFTTRK